MSAGQDVGAAQDAQLERDHDTVRADEAAKPSDIGAIPTEGPDPSIGS